MTDRDTLKDLVREVLREMVEPFPASVRSRFDAEHGDVGRLVFVLQLELACQNCGNSFPTRALVAVPLLDELEGGPTAAFKFATRSCPGCEKAAR